MTWEPGPNRGTDGRHPGHSEPGPSPPRQLVNPAVHRARSQGAQDSWSTAGPRTWAGVTWHSWSTPRALGLNRNSCETAGRTRGLSDTDPRPSELQVNPARARVQTQLPRIDGLTHGPPDTGPSRPGRLVKNAVRLTRVRNARENWLTTGPRTLTGVTWDSWSTPRTLRMECEFPGTPG